MEIVSRLTAQANISILYQELPLLERASAAARDGFRVIESWWPFDQAVPADAEVEAFVDSVEEAGVSLRALNFFAGDMKAGERGILSIPSRLDEFTDGVEVAVEIGRRLGVQKFNALYGNRQDSLAASEQYVAGLAALRRAADATAAINAAVLVEPVSGVASYPLKTAAQARAVIDDIGLPNVQMLADLYHLFVNGEDVPTAIRNNIGVIGHVQIADAPGRHEPGTGSIRIVDLLHLLVSLGYEGSVGLEYLPAGSTSEGLAYLADNVELAEILALPSRETAKDNR
ncbi:hydroxypyruvate isomerase family protein [Leifsonia xyli]|uniref:hydroxypyruvate isomerase family protein n=1 Tax=Leifsonia xyli TaxID=1575 RepID=UPI003D679FAC